MSVYGFGSFEEERRIVKHFFAFCHSALSFAGMIEITRFTVKSSLRCHDLFISNCIRLKAVGLRSLKSLSIYSWRIAGLYENTRGLSGNLASWTTLTSTLFAHLTKK